MNGITDWGLFSSKHLIGLAMMLAYAAVFFTVGIILAKRKSDLPKIWFLRGTALFMILLELLKFILLFRTEGHISAGNFPFALCSMPLYLYPFVAFGKSKFSENLKPAAFVIGLLAGSITIIYPSNVLWVDTPWFANGGYNLAMLSFLYHTTMILFAVYMLVSKNYKMKAFDSVKAFGTLVVLATVAIILNSVIPNADYFMLGKGYGSPFQFIIEKAGLPVYILVMILLGLIVITLLYSYHIIKAIIDRNKKKTASNS